MLSARSCSSYAAMRPPLLLACPDPAAAAAAAGASALSGVAGDGRMSALVETMAACLPCLGGVVGRMEWNGLSIQEQRVVMVGMAGIQRPPNRTRNRCIHRGRRLHHEPNAHGPSGRGGSLTSRPRLERDGLMGMGWMCVGRQCIDL